MSASTEKKNRMAAKADGTHKKTLAAQKEAEKKKKERTKWIVGIVLAAVVLLLLIYLNSGVFYRNTTAVSVDVAAYEQDGLSVAACTDDYSIAEVNYLFRFNYSSFMSQYGSMATYLGLDSTKPLKSQTCAMVSDDPDYTWYDYFMDSTINQLKSYSASCAYARAAGIELDDSDFEEMDEAVDSLAASAKEAGYSLKGYLTYIYGKGTNESVMRSVLEVEFIAMKVQSAVEGEKDYSAEDITAHYEEVADDYDFYSYKFYLVAAETGEADEDGTVPAPTEEAMSAAKEVAEQIKAAVAEGDLETAVVSVLGEEVIPEPTTDEDGNTTTYNASTERTEVQGLSVDSAISEWLKSADRQAGEIGVVEAESNGYYVVVFSDRHTETEATEESGDVPYCDYIAEKLLREADFEAWTEDVFTPIMEGTTSDYAFGAKYVK
ncbi:MAG: hypothetical protein HUJ66_02275 [Oscillospiraceae bacterium]|nr:hypothetical protein [Oscillospiraceae bacterium]